MNVNTYVLKNGVHILTEKMIDVRTCSIGVFVANGSRHEEERLSGISHCIEHMVFKGTAMRSASDIAETFDRLGGHSNAYTTKEMTCFYATCLSNSLSDAAELLADMIIHPKLSEEDLHLERNVIFEEIDMCEDSPEDLVCELISQNSFAGCPVGRPILGGKDILDRMSGNDLRKYISTHYTGDNIFVTVSGKYEPEDISKIKELFSLIPEGKRNQSLQTVYRPSFTLRQKQIEQIHMCIAFPGLSSVDPDRFALRLLNSVFGDGMSSRLFQRIRERESLCYAVGGFPTAVSDCGIYEIYTATGPERQFETLRSISEEVERLLQDGITEDELVRAKQMTEAGLLIALENTGARVELIAKEQMFFKQMPDIDQILEEYRNVTCEQILSLARRLFNKNNISFAAVGENLSSELFRSVL